MGREGREGEIVTSTCWLLMSSCCGTLTTDWSLYSAVRSVDHWTSGRTKTNAVGDNTEAPLAPRPSTPYTTWGQQPQWGGNPHVEHCTGHIYFFSFLMARYKCTKAAIFLTCGVALTYHVTAVFATEPGRWHRCFIFLFRSLKILFRGNEIVFRSHGIATSWERNTIATVISFSWNIITWERNSISRERNKKHRCPFPGSVLRYAHSRLFLFVIDKSIIRCYLYVFSSDFR